jgi:hypothetical protein
MEEMDRRFKSLLSKRLVGKSTVNWESIEYDKEKSNKSLYW